MTHEALLAFHARHYHPSNSYFVTYGDFPLEPHLEQINETLKNFDRIDPHTDLPPEKRLTEPVRIETKCPPAPGATELEADGKLCVAWLCEQPKDQVIF